MLKLKKSDASSSALLLLFMALMLLRFVIEKEKSSNAMRSWRDQMRFAMA